LIEHSDRPRRRASEDILRFGPFQLDRGQRQLLRHGDRMRIGGRALDILIALTERPGAIVTKRELLKQVWPESVIEEGTMRVHVTLLRKILRLGGAQTDYVQNVTGRGYRFAPPVHWEHAAELSDTGDASSQEVLIGAVSTPLPRTNNLPSLATPIFGRTQAIQTLAARVREQRFVTVTGPGGGGKTTLGVSVADTLGSAFAHGVWFVDLARVTEARLVSGALASALGIAALASDPLPEIRAFVSKKELLLVLDNCEHVLEEAACLAETLLRDAPGVHILATSREPMRAVGESVYRLPPLAAPSPHHTLPREQLLEFPAIRLFVDRAGMYADTAIGEDELLLVAGICRRLGGNPLAIEITAAQAGLLGVRALAATLQDDFYLSIGGRRTAVQRQRTLRATLDWSYGLLSPYEQQTFRRLGVFVGGYDLECAAAVVADEPHDLATIFECLTSLTGKSLVVPELTGEKVRYRLLDIPRAFARERLRESGEWAAIRNRHVQMWCTVGRAQIQSRTREATDGVAALGRGLEDLRAAMNWCFSAESDCSLNAKLILTSLWFESVLAAESAGRTAWAQLNARVLKIAHGTLLTQLERLLANTVEGKAPLHNLTVAEQVADSSPEHKTALWSLWIERVFKRDYRMAIRISEAAREDIELSRSHRKPLVHRMLAVAHHYAGDQVLACRHAEWALDGCDAEAAVSSVAASQRCHTRSVLARALWLRGLPDHATQASRQSVSEARLAGDPRLLGIALLTAIGIAIWCGNRARARRSLELLQEQSARLPLDYQQVWADCLGAILQEPAGRLHSVEPLQLSTDPLTSSQYLEILGTLSEELVSTDSIVRVENGRGGWCAPEILRVKAERLLHAKGPDAIVDAETLLSRALDTARWQGALSWELRTANSLARLWRDQGQISRARDLLTEVYGRFTEGFETADLTSARQLLQELGAPWENKEDWLCSCRHKVTANPRACP
jgi:predicted ATPase/DNA-binding winged helix-turn-helix (wHTH) protein